MDSHSPAQHLPAHIVHMVATYLLPDRRLPVNLLDIIRLPYPKMQRKLLPLMHVCREWRDSTCRLFYRTVFCRDEPCDLYGMQRNDSSKCVWLNTAVKLGCQGYIQTVVVDISVAELLYSNVDPSPPVRELRRYGPLGQVRNLCIMFTADETSRRDAEAAHSLSENGSAIVQGCKNFRECIRTALPGLRRIDTDFWLSCESQKVWAPVINRAMSGLGSLVGEPPICMPEWGGADARHTFYSLTASLQSISLELCRDKPEAIEFIRRNAASLKQLYFTYPPVHSAMGIIADGSSTVVYPHLKRLLIKAADDPYNRDLSQQILATNPPRQLLEIDPFPQLAVFECQGRLLTLSMVALGCGYSHIRCLKINTDMDELASLESAGLLRRGLFRSLRHLTIGAKCTRLDENNAQHLQRALSISDSLYSLELAMSLEVEEDFVYWVGFPATLRLLDIRICRIYTKDIVTILSRCPQLQYVITGVSQMIEHHPIRTGEFRFNYTLGTAGVTDLAIYISDSVSWSEACSEIVALLDAITSLTRVTIYSGERDLPCSLFLDAFKRHCCAFEDDHLCILDRIRIQFRNSSRY